MGILLCREKEPNAILGSFVFKVFNVVSRISAFMLLICALAFEEVHIFKPVMSRWTNDEKYVICRNKRPVQDQVINLLTKMVNMETDDEYVSDFEGIEFPKEFTEWLTKANNDSIESEIKATSQLVRLINGQKVENLPRANLHQLLIVLDLPGENDNSN